MTPPNGTTSPPADAAPRGDAGPAGEPVPDSRLAVVVPARDNERVIGSLVLLARRHAGSVVVADLGSTDRTPDLAREAGAEVVFVPVGNRSAGVLAGCRAAPGAGAVVLLEPDGTDLADEIPRLAAPVLAGEADLAIGSRSLSERAALLAGPVPAAPSALTDPGSTFRALGPRALDLLDHLPGDGDLDEGMTRLVSRRGLVVTELPSSNRHPAVAGGTDDLPRYRGKRVAVVVPAYNEELLVGETLAGIPDFVARVYVVNDCSTDRTGEIVDHYAEKDPSIVAIHHETNQGVGAAIITGYRRALEDGMEVVAVMAGDNQMDPDFLPHLLDPIVDGKCDYTMGNRLANTTYRQQMSRWRFFGNSLLTLLTKIASGYWQMVDPQNGYTAISARALNQVDLSEIYPRYGYCNDLLIRLNVWGFRVVNVPHPARYGREKSGIQYRSYITRLSRLLLTGFIGRLKTKYVVMSFHPLVIFYFAGVVLCVFGILGSLFSIYYKIVEHGAMFVPSVTSLIIFTLGTQFWLFAMLFDMQQEQENSSWYQ